MRADDATVENPTLKLPADLLHAVSRQDVTRKVDYRLEGWRPSLLGRLIEKLRGRERN